MYVHVHYMCMMPFVFVLIKQQFVIFLSCRAVKTVIIDCAPIGFMDAVGVKSLQQVS